MAGLGGLCLFSFIRKSSAGYRWFHGRLLCVSLLLGGISQIHAQEYSYTHYTVKDGLAGATVYCMVQDREGFLWIGTETGLSRFDGTHFVNFSSMDGLPDNEILRLYVDTENRIWIMPFKTTICYYSKGIIHNQENDSVLKRIDIASEIISVAEDSNKNIYFLQRNSVSILHPGGQIVKVDRVEGKEFSAIKGGIGASGKFRAFLSVAKSGSAVAEFAPDGDAEFKADVSAYHPGSYSSTFISPRLDIFRIKDSLAVFRNNNNSQLKLHLPEGFLGVSVINDSLIALHTVTKCIVYNIIHPGVYGIFLEGEKIACSLMDNEGSIWFCSIGRGLFRLGSPSFRNFSLDSAKKFSSAYCISRMGSDLLIGGDQFTIWKLGLHSFELKKQHIFKAYSSGRVLSVSLTPDSAILAGTDAGLLMISKDGSDITPIRRPSIKDIFQQSDTAIVATGINVFALSTRPVKVLGTVWNKRATSVLRLNGTTYIGTLDGLYSVDDRGNIIDYGKDYHILKNRISSITASDDRIWVGTYGMGIIGLNNDSPFVNITVYDGLTSNICRSLYASGKYLWVGTDKGLNRVNTQEPSASIISYNSVDGIASDIINAIYVEGSRVFAGGPKGLTFFDEKYISRNSTCLLRMTALINSDRNLINDSLPLLFSPDQNNIRFEFVGISFKSAGNIKYHYFLKGLDTSWHTTSQTFISYPSLPSGKYTFEIFAVNKFGVASETMQTDFTIEKIIWLKPWMLSLLTLVVGGIIWMLIAVKIKKIRKQEYEKQQTSRKVARLEQMALKAQMNPHFIFNSLNSIQQYVIDKDLAGANNFITEFARLIRLTLDFTSKTRISLDDEIKYLATYLKLEKTRFEDKFNFQISVADNINVSSYFIPPMILQPYVENSIRHGIRHRTDNLGRILIKFMVANNSLIVSIKDNGIGRAKAAEYNSREPVEYQSKGMSLTAKRIEMMNLGNPSPISIEIHDLVADSGNSDGTEIVVIFPLEQ